MRPFSVEPAAVRIRTSYCTDNLKWNKIFFHRLQRNLNRFFKTKKVHASKFNYLSNAVRFMKGVFSFEIKKKDIKKILFTVSVARCSLLQEFERKKLENLKSYGRNMT